MLTSDTATSYSGIASKQTKVKIMARPKKVKELTEEQKQEKFAQMVRNDYKECLRSGFRPTEILLCVDGEGSVCQWDVKNSKELEKVLQCSSFSLWLQEDEYITWDTGRDWIEHG